MRILLFGGNGVEKGLITIFDVESHKIRQSSLQCPDTFRSRGDEYRALLIENYGQSDKIINGYLRQSWKEQAFMGMHELPVELIRLLTKFYSQEYVHLFVQGYGEHYKILLDEVFSAQSDCFLM